MLTALGDDSNGSFIRSACREVGIDLSMSVTFPDEVSSTYLCLNDEHGDVVCAVSDMSVCDRLTPEVIQPHLPQLRQAAMIVMDANLPEETIDYVASQVSCPLFADPVSVAKAGRLKAALRHLTMIKPNAAEASLLTGVTIDSREDLETAAGALLRRGLKYVVISLGGDGVYWHDGHRSGIQPCLPTPVINTNGCGDAFLAAAASSYLEHGTLADMVRCGIAGSAICAGSSSAVSHELSHSLLLDYVKRYTEDIH